MKITKHIYFYEVKEGNPVDSSNAIVIKGNNRQIIIDPGTNINKRLYALVNDMKQDGSCIDKTTEIWLTHSHPDHSQMIHDLSKRFGEQRLVRCHPLGIPILNNPNLKENFIFQEKKKAGPYWKLLFTSEDRKKLNSAKMRPIVDMIKEGISILWRKVNNIESFFDGEIINVSPIDVQIMFLPGHTYDEIGFWIAEEKILITGDLVNISQDEERTKYKLILYNFHSDLDQALDSIKKMISKNPEILLTPHGILVKGNKKINEILDKLIFYGNNYKTMAKKFVEEHPDFTGFRSVRELAKQISSSDLLDIEKRFIALAALKSTGAIK